LDTDTFEDPPLLVHMTLAVILLDNMTTFKIILATSLFHVTVSSLGFPCTKYIIDGGLKAAPGKVMFTWSINAGFNNCAFNKDEILKHQFIVTIEDIFEKILLKDTVEQNFFITNTKLGDKGVMMVSIEELDNAKQRYDAVIRTADDGLFSMQNKIDSLNAYVLNGYLVNAFSILADMGRLDLIDGLLQQYNILFPDHYPDRERFLNCYLEPKTLALIRMPAVNGLPSFVKELNKLTKAETKRLHGFRVYGKVVGETLESYTVIPESDKRLFDKLSHLLSFDGNRDTQTDVIIIVGRSKNKKHFTIVNERALMNTESKGFRKTYPYRGAIY
jgi:hypothetical protein